MAKVYLPVLHQPHVVIEATGDESIQALDAAQILDLYKTHGAILLRGFGVDVASFGAFAKQFCTTAVVNESPGREPVDVAANVFTVDAGDGAFALHPELSREPWEARCRIFWLSGCAAIRRSDHDL